MKFPTRTVNLFLLWILFSLLAIAYIGQHPYLGLAIAIIGGIVLGVMSFLYYEPEPPRQEPPAEDVDDDQEDEAATHNAIEDTSDTEDSE